MINVKQAVKAAAQQLREVFQDAPIQNLLLEEVELSDDDKYWLITLSYTFGAATSATMGNFSGLERTYKTVKVDSETGQARAIKMRVLA